MKVWPGFSVAWSAIALAVAAWPIQSCNTVISTCLPVLQNIIDSNNSVREALEKGLDAVKLQENWDYLQINCAMYINSDMPGVASQSQPNTKPLRQAQVLSITCVISVYALLPAN